jgi:hypothetical protein
VAYHSRKFKPADVNWEHFATSKVLTARRACRSEHHADVLSRRWDNALKEGGEPSPVGFFIIEQYLCSSFQLRLEGTATLLHRCKHVACADTTAEAVNGVFEDTALSFKLSAAAGLHSHSCASMQTCGWC